MTDGRFEATNSIRPNNWDQRRLWCERPQFVKLDPEIRYDESCPFHDLKADGCLQPEYGLMHDNKRATTPETLSRRPDGNRMKMGGPHPPNRFGMGGHLLPLDPTGPNMKAVPRKGGPQWNGGGTKNGLFSTPGYVASPSVPPVPVGPAAPLAPAPAFGNKIKLGAPVPYMPDDRRPQTGPINFRLKAGSAKPRALAAVLPPVGPGAEKPKRIRSPIARHAFRDHSTIQGTFGGPAKHMPTPYHDGPLESRTGRPLFTYAPKSKRNAPIQNPWTTLVQTADPVAGYNRTIRGTTSYNGTTTQNTTGTHSQHMSGTEGTYSGSKGALNTYSPKSKRSAPIQNTFSTMVQTADPVKHTTRTVEPAVVAGGGGGYKPNVTFGGTTTYDNASFKSQKEY